MIRSGFSKVNLEGPGLVGVGNPPIKTVLLRLMILLSYRRQMVV